jgi:hypothetical protein
VKDFLGKEMAKDDILIIRMPDYAGLCLARVLAFTPPKVRVEYFNTWNYGRDKPRRMTRLIESYMVAKVDDESATAYRTQRGELFSEELN